MLIAFRTIDPLNNPEKAGICSQPLTGGKSFFQTELERLFYKMFDLRLVITSYRIQLFVKQNYMFFE